MQENEQPASIVRREFRALVEPDRADGIDDTPLAELGVDSLDFFEKKLLLEEDHGIDIPLSELDNDVTINQIVSMLKC